jgi:lysophospholipase L1-like esterase
MKNATLLFYALIEEMNQLCLNNNCKLVIVNLPIKIQFDGSSLNNNIFDQLKIQKILKNVTQKNDIKFLDLYPIINDSDEPLDYYIDSEYHLDEDGHKLVGDELYKFLNKELLIN